MESATAMKLKLNLGCNTRIREGYVNIDKDKYLGVDVVADVAKLEYANNSVSEIYASHILEHFSHLRTVDILKEWHRVLEDGGILKLSVPDFDRMIKLYQKTGLVDWLTYVIWGGQEYDGAFHYCGFNESRLRKALALAGFTDISRVENLPGASNNECSTKVDNLDFKSISINMVVVKGE